MIKQTFTAKRLLVLDTNVIMHDPTAFIRFQEHDIFIPMTVLEELDNGKKGLTEVARNVRQVNRFIDELIADASEKAIAEGIPLSSLKNLDNGRTGQPSGRLFFQNMEINTSLPSFLPGTKADNTILATVMDLQLKHPETKVTLVSKDISLRIKACTLGIHAEDYFNDRVLDDLTQLHSGLHVLAADFWETHGKDIESWQENGKTYYRVTGPYITQWFPNDCLTMENDENFRAVVRHCNADHAIIQMAKDYSNPKHAIWGITARNTEQSFALNLLMDPSVAFISLQGHAGSGKTLITLAAALAQTLEQNLYQEIIMTRVTVPVGEDIGFLPGTEEEKMTPWMGALMDNLDVLNNPEDGDSWTRDAGNDLIQNRIRIRSLNFMRGRTFLNRFVILDEAQNLTSKQIKTLVTRAGPGSKIVCLGDLAQIDTPYLTSISSGLTYAVDRFKTWEHSGHMTLVRGERSKLADFAAENL